VGFGWIPAYDQPANLDPDNGQYSNSERKHCVAVFNAHGITFDNPNAEFAALEFCGTLDLLKLSLDRTPNTLTPTAFVQAIDSLGTAYTAPTALGNHFAVGQHDSASKGYFWRYFSDCQCLHYTGPLRTIPG
jgi:hypothetical protein